MERDYATAQKEARVVLAWLELAMLMYKRIRCSKNRIRPHNMGAPWRPHNAAQVGRGAFAMVLLPDENAD